MTLRFRPENGSNSRFLENGVPEHHVYFPQNELPNDLYKTLAPFSSNKNLRRGTVIAHDEGLYVEDSRITAQGYKPGSKTNILKEQLPPDGLYVQIPHGQTMEWGYLTHYTEPQGLVISSSPRKSARSQPPRPTVPQTRQEHDNQVSRRREKIRQTLIRFAHEIADENEGMKKKAAWKQAVREYDKDYGIPWFRPDLRLRRRTLLVLGVGLAASGGIVDYVLHSNDHSDQSFNKPPTKTGSADVKIEGIELPNASIKLENLENPTGIIKYAALTVNVQKGMSLVLFVHNGTMQDVGVFPLSNPKNAHDDLTNWRKKRQQLGIPIFIQSHYFPTVTDTEILILNQVEQNATDLVILQGNKAGNAPQFVARLAENSNQAKQIASELIAKYSLGNLIPVTKNDYPQMSQNDPGFK